ncbi:MAG: hypothetical protein ACRBN8_27785 [Nannocystales bacterium]
MSAAPGFPDDAAEIDADDGRVSLVVDAELYPRDAVYAAVMPMLATAFVMLDQSPQGRTRIELRPREASNPGALRAMLGGLANELLVATTRSEIAKRRGGLLEAVTRRAVSGAMGAPSLDDLEGFDLDGDAFEDPLGIADSWDRSHGTPQGKDDA